MTQFIIRAAITVTTATTIATTTFAAKPSVPLEASSKWNVDYGDTACLLGRRFGEGKSETLLVFRQLPLSTPELDVMVQIRSSRDQFVLGNATFTVDGAPAGDGGYEAYPTRTAGVRTAVVGAYGNLRDKLPDNGTFTVALGRDTPFAFTLHNTKAAFAALDTCNKSIMKEWGVDPSEQDRITTPPEPRGNPARWFGPEDYPASVWAKGAQGTTILLWVVGVDGRISGCRTIVASGEPELDKTACDALTKRARYSPAIDRDGKPIVAHMSRRIIWRLQNWQGSQKPVNPPEKP